MPPESPGPMGLDAPQLPSGGWPSSQPPDEPDPDWPDDWPDDDQAGAPWMAPAPGGRRGGGAPPRRRPLALAVVAVVALAAGAGVALAVARGRLGAARRVQQPAAADRAGRQRRRRAPGVRRRQHGHPDVRGRPGARGQRHVDHDRRPGPLGHGRGHGLDPRHGPGEQHPFRKGRRSCHRSADPDRRPDDRDRDPGPGPAAVGRQRALNGRRPGGVIMERASPARGEEPRCGYS